MGAFKKRLIEEEEMGIFQDEQIEEADMEADMMDEDIRWADEFTNNPTEESEKSS